MDTMRASTNMRALSRWLLRCFNVQIIYICASPPSTMLSLTITAPERAPLLRCIDTINRVGALPSTLLPRHVDEGDEGCPDTIGRHARGASYTDGSPFDCCVDNQHLVDAHIPTASTSSRCVTWRSTTASYIHRNANSSFEAIQHGSCESRLYRGGMYSISRIERHARATRHAPSLRRDVQEDVQRRRNQEDTTEVHESTTPRRFAPRPHSSLCDY